MGNTSTKVVLEKPKSLEGNDLEKNFNGKTSPTQQARNNSGSGTVRNETSQRSADSKIQNSEDSDTPKRSKYDDKVDLPPEIFEMMRPALTTGAWTGTSNCV